MSQKRWLAKNQLQIWLTLLLEPDHDVGKFIIQQALFKIFFRTETKLSTRSWLLYAYLYELSRMTKHSKDRHAKDAQSNAANLHQWIGKQQASCDVVSNNAIKALAATLDHQHTHTDEGTALPALWHWLFFLNPANQSELGEDGHAAKGNFLPPIELPRRMWAGSQFQFHHPIVVGDHIRRLSTIENISKKSGRSGELIFVKVKHEISITDNPDKQRLAITEYHDIVYREAAPTTTNATSEHTQAPLNYDWKLEIEPDDVLLFRYSALTFNSHRIHYDRRYATQVEGYPGLVVHGPLISTLLLDGMHQQLGTQVIMEFQFKALKPVFDTHPFFVCGKLADDKKTVNLWATDHLNNLTMQATATLA